MTAPRTSNPSPLAGEGAERTRSVREAGEGDSHVRPHRAGRRPQDPSPGHSLRSRPPSPARGEGKIGASQKRFGSAGSRAGEKMIGQACSLRSRMTDAERKLWYALRDRRFARFKFRRQVPIGPFVADFICYQERLVIEVDGGQHADSQRDRRRDRWLEANRFRVLRFWNNDVLMNLEGVSTLIANALMAGQSS